MAQRCAARQQYLERLALNELTRAGFETYTPRILYRRVSHGRRIETTPLLFPSYVFVRIVLHTPQGIRPV